MKKLLAVICLFTVGLSAQPFSDSTSFARPATNATAYANGDIVATSDSLGILRFTKFGKSSFNRGYITAGGVEVDTASTAGGFRLWLFKDTTDFAKVADNAAWTAPAAMMATQLIGFIDFNLSSSGIGAGAGGNADWVTNLNIPYEEVGSRGIYGRIAVTSAHTPKAGGRFKVVLKAHALVR